MYNIFDNYSDKELVRMVLDKGEEKPMTYFLYDRYSKTLNYNIKRLFGNLYYWDDLVADLFCHIKGRDGRWKKLSSFKWDSKFATWLSTVSYNFFVDKRPELIGFDALMESIDTVKTLNMEYKEDKDRRDRVIMMYDAIAQLNTDDETERNYKFVLIKELEGYSGDEIARKLYAKRKRENRVRRNKGTGEEIIPTTEYVYMLKSRAIRLLKSIIYREAINTEAAVSDELIAKYIDNKASKEERKKVLWYLGENVGAVENMLYLMDDDWEEEAVESYEAAEDYSFGDTICSEDMPGVCYMASPRSGSKLFIKKMLGGGEEKLRKDKEAVGRYDKRQEVKAPRSRAREVLGLLESMWRG